jgi:hypothetical protein
MSEPEEPGSPLNKRPGNGAGHTAAGRFAKGNKLGPGRPKGSRNQRAIELEQMLAARGDLHPADFLSMVMNGLLPGVELGHRIAAATALLPYRLARPHPSRFISKSIDLPPPSSATQAAEQLAQIAVLMAGGKLDLDEGAVLSKVIRDYVEVFRTSEVEALVMRTREEIYRKFSQ